MVAAAVIGAAVIGAGASMASSNAASKSQEGAANKANATLNSQFQQTQQNEMPFIQQGQAANAQLSNLLGIGSPSQGSTNGDNGWFMSPDGTMQQRLTNAPSDSSFGSLTKPFTQADYLNNQDPGYQFQLQQGSQALQNASGAGSGSMSGAAMKDLIGYNQNYAATGYQNAFNRYTTQQNNIYSRLAGIAQMGQNAASQTGSIGANIAGSVAANQVGIGNAQAANSIATGNAMSGAANSLGTYYMWSGMNGGGNNANFQNYGNGDYYDISTVQP